MGPILGIDLGTTNTVVAVADAHGVRALTNETGAKLIPSVVSFHPNGRVLVGAEARERRVIDARNTVYSVKRLIGRPFESEAVGRAAQLSPFSIVRSPSGGVAVAARGQTFELPEISAMVLGEARRVAEQALGVSCTRAVVTVPANFSDLQRAATHAAGRIAGIDVVRILNEPTAAALAYGLVSPERERIVVFDLGGGTFDVTILELAGDVFEVIATAGDTFLGGDDIDRLLVDQLAESFLVQHRTDPRVDPQSLERLRTAAEWAKCELSFRPVVDVNVSELAYGAGGRALDLFARLDVPRFEALVRPMLERTLRVCDDALRIAGIAPSQVDNVVLVGGSTRIPMVHRLVEQHFGRRPLSTVDPDLVVALGAAVQGRALTSEPELPSLAFVPVASSLPPGVPAEVVPLDATTSMRLAPPPRVPPRVSRVAPPEPPDLVAAPRAESPLLVDVTPLTLGIETAGGFCEPVIPRNAAIPCEQSKSFGTAQDLQTVVRLRVCQGESRRFDENQPLGELVLEGIRPAARGRVEIRVTFAVDDDGAIAVEAVDAETGQLQRTRLARVGAIADDRMEALRDRHKAMMHGGSG